MSTRSELESAVFGDGEAINALAQKIDTTAATATQTALAAVESRMAFRRAVDWFEAEYSNELADPVLKKLMYDKDSELAHANPTLPYRERLKKAGDEIRNWRRKKVGASDLRPEESQPEERLSPDGAQRRPAVNVRPAVREDVDGEPSVEEVSDTIQAMARARGQSVASVHRWRVR